MNTLALLVSIALAPMCEDADVQVLRFNYSAAILALDVCLETAAPEDRAVLLMRQGVLKAELLDDAGARERFFDALQQDENARPSDNVSPKTFALFSEVLEVFRASEQTGPPRAEDKVVEPVEQPPPQPVEPQPVVVEAPETGSLLPVGLMSAGGAVVLVGAGVFVYGAFVLPVDEELSQRELLEQSTAFQTAGQATAIAGLALTVVGALFLFVE